MAQYGGRNRVIVRVDSRPGTGPAMMNTIEPDVVMACAGDIPTLETIAAAWWLRHHIPELKVRVVNVVDLMTLYPRICTRMVWIIIPSSSISLKTDPWYSRSMAIHAPFMRSSMDAPMSRVSMCVV